MISESKISMAVLEIASRKEGEIASFQDCYSDIPNIFDLGPDDWEPSVPRNGEPLWKQRVRNIQSHHGNEDNFIFLGYLEHVPDIGYKITEKGKNYLRENPLYR